MNFYDEILSDRIRDAVVQFLSDDGRYKCKFEIRSETSDKIYRISFDMASSALYWTCSCPGNIRHGHCKHLKAMNLPGRAYGPSHEWEEKLKSNNPFTGAPYGTYEGERGSPSQWKEGFNAKMSPGERKPNLRKPSPEGKKRRIRFDEE